MTSTSPADEVPGAPGAEAGTDRARSVLAYITGALVGQPDALVVETEPSARGVRFRVRVADGDMGRLIGRRGRVAQAIRTLVRLAGSRDGVDANVEFVDD